MPAQPAQYCSLKGWTTLSGHSVSIAASWPIGSNCGARADEALGRHDRKGLNEDDVHGLDQHHEGTRPADLCEGAERRETLHEAEANLEGGRDLQRKPGGMVVANRPCITNWSEGTGARWGEVEGQTPAGAWTAAAARARAQRSGSSRQGVRANRQPRRRRCGGRAP